MKSEKTKVPKSKTLETNESKGMKLTPRRARSE
jgi:hypothetical protein